MKSAAECHSEEKSRKFGSFFSSDVEQLLSKGTKYEKSEDIYERCKTQYTKHKRGNSDMKQLFPSLRPNVIFLNHGAFGRTLLGTLKLAQMYQLEAEADPCKFYDREYIPLACEAQCRMAEFLGCESTDFVFVQNVTNGISSVLQALGRKHRPLNVLSLSCNYGQTNKLLWAKDEAINVTIVHVDPFSDSDPSIIDSVQRYLPNIHVALFDHITSQHARILPVVELCRLCKANGVLSIVDGAHALGQLFPHGDSPFPPAGDYYVTSCHKWFCGHKGVAMLFYDKSTGVPPLPATRSHGIDHGTQSEFVWSGLRDYSATLSILDTIAFWEVFKPADVISRNRKLCSEASRVLCDLWNTKVLGTAGCMACVRLPDSVTKLAMTKVVRDKLCYDHAEYIQDRLYTNKPKSVQVSVKCHRPKVGSPFLYVRMSTHVYNCIDDVAELGIITLSLLEDPKE